MTARPHTGAAPRWAKRLAGRYADTLQRTKPEPCPTCGTPHSVLNGAWFRRERLYSGVTLRGMAARLGVSPAYASDMELGKRAFLPKYVAAYEALR